VREEFLPVEEIEITNSVDDNDINSNQNDEDVALKGFDVVRCGLMCGSSKPNDYAGSSSNGEEGGDGDEEEDGLRFNPSRYCHERIEDTSSGTTDVESSTPKQP